MPPEPTPPRLPPYLAFFLTLAVIAPLHALYPLATVIPWPYRLVGPALIVGGLAVASGQQRAIQRHGQGGMYTDIPTRLITDGVFGFSRNPLYLGMVLLTLGIAVLLGTLGPLVLVGIEVVVMTRWGIPYEESVLASRFGEEFEQYRRRVRRWL